MPGSDGFWPSETKTQDLPGCHQEYLDPTSIVTYKATD